MYFRARQARVDREEKGMLECRHMAAIVPYINAPPIPFTIDIILILYYYISLIKLEIQLISYNHILAMQFIF